MVRAGLDAESVVRAGAELADEIGFEQVTPSSSPARWACAPRACTRT